MDGKVGGTVHCFAGRPIINANRESNKIDAAAVTLTSSAEMEIKEINRTSESNNRPDLSAFLVEYPLPMKNAGAKRCQVVNFARFHGDNFLNVKGNDRDIVSRCFWDHGKDIGPAEYGKLTNIEMLLRYLKRKSPAYS